jgi:predicted nucleotidyltransferase
MSKEGSKGNVLVIWKEFDYPQDVIRQLDALGELLVAESQPCSILLLGSVARGELAYTELDGRPEVFSDYELLVVTERRLPARQRQRIATQLAGLEREFGQGNPLFHIDAIFRERRRLCTLPRIIFTYEMKANAQVLRGEDVRPLLPEVTLANLNLRNVNEILIKRLWAILLHTPRRLLRGSLTRLEEMVWGYVLCRNALDLTTVLLPHCGVLLPSYGKRVRHLAKHYGQLGLASHFGEDLLPFLVACLHERRSLRFSELLSHRYDRVIGYLAAVLEFLLDQAGATDGPLDQRLITCSRCLFNKWPISRGEWVNLARLTAHYARGNGPLAAGRWLWSLNKGIITAGLLAAHSALIAHQVGRDDEAAGQLAESTRLLARIAVTPLPPLEGNFATRWLALRRAWGDFWREYVRLGDPKYRARFDFVTEWEDD